ncbi:hypothetical protein BKA65DRAFT_559754 [Rhexocercosporidium sp. MPI-PUGE-AT-0058]|nr:hypothetical protein BKA65DRAFT_559754 [Rhexocercosporidium sp. MPI-PUGE-AT-0058]
MSHRLSNINLPQEENIDAGLELMEGELESLFDSSSPSTKDVTAREGILAIVNDNAIGVEDALAMLASITDTKSASVPLDEFPSYVKLPLELRTMVMKFSLPRVAIIQLKHRTHGLNTYIYQRCVQMIVDTTDNFTIAQFRESPLPLTLHISYARRQRKQSKLRFSHEDLLYCKTFMYSNIPVHRTFDALVRQDLFKDVTRIALSCRGLDDLLSSASLREQFLKIFPRLKELELLDHWLRPTNPTATRFGANGYHGLCPDPVGFTYDFDSFVTKNIAYLQSYMKGDDDVISGKAIVPQITFL